MNAPLSRHGTWTVEDHAREIARADGVPLTPAFIEAVRRDLEGDWRPVTELADEQGRDPRFPPGWWVLPGAVPGALFLGWLLSKAVANLAAFMGGM